MCMPMFNRKLCKVIKSTPVANVHHVKIKFNETDYVVVQIRPEIFVKHSFKKLFTRACGLYCFQKFSLQCVFNCSAISFIY